MYLYMHITVLSMTGSVRQVQGTKRDSLYTELSHVAPFFELFIFFYSKRLAHICWVGSNTNCIALLNTVILTWKTDD
jgi:hypothetical protein